MQIDPADHPVSENYKLLTNLVIPRPIAWVTSLDEAGLLNLAPYSFFNAVGADPLYIVIGVGRRDEGSLKDTGRNIDARGEFVVHMVTEDLLADMNVTAADFPADQSELPATSLETLPSLRVGVPRLAAAQVSLECRLFESHPIGANRLYIGEIVMFHVADALVGERLRIHDFAPVGRLGSPSVYCRTTDRFNVARVSHADLMGSPRD